MKTWVTATILALVVLVAAGITVGVVTAKKKETTDKTPAPPTDSEKDVVVVPPTDSEKDVVVAPPSNQEKDDASESQPSPQDSSSQDTFVECDYVSCPTPAHTFVVNNGETFKNVCGANDADNVCQEKKVAKCCKFTPMCGGHTCSAGYNKLTNSDNKKCKNEACDDNQCCYEAPTCGEGDCGTGKRRTPENVCGGQTCTPEECCVDKTTCGTSFACRSDQTNKPSNTECAGETCTNEECCDKLTCDPGYEPNNRICAKCRKKLPVIEGVVIGVWQTNKCQYDCQFGFVKSSTYLGDTICTCPYEITKTGNTVTCGVDVESTVVTEKNVYRSDGYLDFSKAQCPGDRTFVIYDRETCKAYQVHNNFEWKTESLLLPKGCTQTSRNGKTYVTFNSDHGVKLCRKRNRNSFARTVCRNAYRDARSVGFCKRRR